MDKKCADCGVAKARSQFRRMPSGRLYRRCAACHVPRSERRPREYYRSAAYKRECRQREAARQGRKLRPFRAGAERTAVSRHDQASIKQFAICFALALLLAAPYLDAQYASDRELRKRARWLASRHARRGRERSQADGTLDTDAIAALFQSSSACAHCGVTLTSRAGRRRYLPTDATLDHVVPLSRGGIHGLSNVVIACAGCNFGRHNRLIDEVPPFGS